MVGYASPDSLAGRLIAGNRTVWMFKQEYNVIAEVRSIQSMSAHGDYEDLLHFLHCQDPQKVKKIFLVHGEYEVQQHFKTTLQEKGYHNVEIPAQHTRWDLE